MIKKKLKDLTLKDCINICQNHCKKHHVCSSDCSLSAFCWSTNWDITDVKEFRDDEEIKINER